MAWFRAPSRPGLCRAMQADTRLGLRPPKPRAENRACPRCPRICPSQLLRDIRGTFVAQKAQIPFVDGVEGDLPKPKVAGSRPVVRLGEGPEIRVFLSLGPRCGYGRRSRATVLAGSCPRACGQLRADVERWCQGQSTRKPLSRLLVVVRDGRAGCVAQRRDPHPDHLVRAIPLGLETIWLPRASGRMPLVEGRRSRRVDRRSWSP
jgi:hypothetical protein